jgi:ABC-2 type transport system ATP-binding protein
MTDPAETTPLLRVDRLSKTYGRIRALTDVSFSIRPGEVLGVIGPNGAGKTTLFECLARLLPIDAGGEALATSLFYMPDGIAPWPAQTVAWALDFAVGFFGGMADRRQDVIARLNLDPILHTRIGALSKGQRKRALLAFALLTPQPLLLIDEPFDGLDLRQSRDVAVTLRGEVTRGRTLVLSIHQMSDAARVCDRFVLLSAGQVRGEGTLAELSGQAAASGRAASAATLEEVFLALT